MAPAHALYGFYSTDLEEVRRALAAQGASCGEVTSDDIPVLRSDGRQLFPRGSLFNEAVFGPARDFMCACGGVAGQARAGEVCERCGTLCDSSELRSQRFGHVFTTPHVHPAAYAALAAALGHAEDDVRALARAERVLKGDVLAPFDEWDDESLMGPAAVQALLRARSADHPLLCFASLEAVPVPPAGDRPFVPAQALGATQVHPWIGPLNELWRGFVVQARRERRLIELDAPALIRQTDTGRTQVLLDRIWQATRRPPKLPQPSPEGALANEGRLVPPLAKPVAARSEHEMDALAFVGDRLVLQSSRGVQVLDGSGDTLFTLPPAGCRLVGALDERVAVFFEYFSETHPAFSEDHGFGPDHVVAGEQGCVHVAPVCGEISAVDAVAGSYLERAPAGLPRHWCQNDQPEELFRIELETGEAIPINIGGDRPQVLAMSPGLRFGWCGEGDDTQIFDLQTGIPHATPRGVEEVEQVLDLITGSLRPVDTEAGEDSIDCVEEASSCAVAYGAGRWWLLSEWSVLSDHAGQRPVRLTPSPHAAAFDADAARLAVAFDGGLAIVDVATLAVRRVR